MKKNITEEMSFLDHLEELRWHLIRSVLAIVIVATAAFIFKDFILMYCFLVLKIKTLLPIVGFVHYQKA